MLSRGEIRRLVGRLFLPSSSLPLCFVSVDLASSRPFRGSFYNTPARPPVDWPEQSPMACPMAWTIYLIETEPTWFFGTLKKMQIPFVLLSISVGAANAFSIRPTQISRTPRTTTAGPVGVAASTLQRTGDATGETNDEVDGGGSDCEVLLLDHLNINHEKGRVSVLV